MERIEAYRNGASWSLEPTTGVADSPVYVELGTGVKLARSGKGQLLLYKEHVPYGQPLAGALALGWARVISIGSREDGATAEGRAAF